MTSAYKTLNGTSGSYGYGDYSGYMPHGKRPGKWLPKVKPVLCESGYHVCEQKDVLRHLGQHLYEVEVRGECDRGDDKAAWEQMRLVRRVPEWNDETMRLFAVDCARVTVNRYADHDQRGLLHACLDVMAGFAEGFVDDAARAAAGAAARAAAWATAAAAWAAAGAAARAAAGYAAWSAARAEQAALLTRYLAGEVGPLAEES